jgi:hypothetical protein
MRKVHLSLPLVVTFCLEMARFAAADEPASVERLIYPRQMLVCPDNLLRACCDIYCCKPLPCIPCLGHGCCQDNYCSKPCPRVPGFCQSCVKDCYCRKPCPDLCRPIAADYFSCVPLSATCAGRGASNGNRPSQEPHFTASTTP